MTNDDTTTGAPGARREDDVYGFHLRCRSPGCSNIDWFREGTPQDECICEECRLSIATIRRESRAAALEEAAQIVENLSIRRWADGLTCTQFCAEGIRQAIAAPGGSDGGVNEQRDAAIAERARAQALDDAEQACRQVGSRYFGRNLQRTLGNDDCIDAIRALRTAPPAGEGSDGGVAL